MRFLKSFLAENTPPKELTKPTKPGFDSFVSTGDLVSEALEIFGGRVLSPEESREIMAEDEDWAAIQAEPPKGENGCSHCGGKMVKAKWPDGSITTQCHGCGREKKTSRMKKERAG